MSGFSHPRLDRRRPLAGLKFGAMVGAGVALAMGVGLVIGETVPLAWIFPEPTFRALAVFGDDVDVVDFNLTAQDCADRIKSGVANACEPEGAK